MNEDVVNDLQKQTSLGTSMHDPGAININVPAKFKEDDMEEEELKDLLDFTNNLDFEDFIEDLEVKHALEKLKKRVEELTPRRRDRGRVLLQKGMDGDSLLQKAGETTLRPLTKEALDELERQIGQETSKRQDHDSRSVVSESSILSDTKSLRSVHSSRSIAAIRKQIAAYSKLTIDQLRSERNPPTENLHVRL